MTWYFTLIYTAPSSARICTCCTIHAYIRSAYIVHVLEAADKNMPLRRTGTSFLDPFLISIISLRVLLFSPSSADRCAIAEGRSCSRSANVQRSSPFAMQGNACLATRFLGYLPYELFMVHCIASHRNDNEL